MLAMAQATPGDLAGLISSGLMVCNQGINVYLFPECLNLTSGLNTYHKGVLVRLGTLLSIEQSRQFLGQPGTPRGRRGVL
jgi:hypothetical protein